jgi:hypothetical protein
VRRPTDRTTRAQRFATLALSGAWTACAVLLLFAGPRPGRLIERLSATRDPAPAGERVVYVVTEPTTEPAASAPVSPRPSSRPARATPRADTASRTAAPAPPAPTGTPSTLPRIPTTLLPPDPSRDASASSRDVRASAGAPAAAVVSGFSRPRDSLAADSSKHVVRGAMSAGRVRAAVVEQALRDEEMRAQARAAMAARAAGTPDPPAVAGTGIYLPLPFGGPSRKQRERDRAVHARTLEMLGRLHRKADSLAARRRRTADSVVVPRDSTRDAP